MLVSRGSGAGGVWSKRKITNHKKKGTANGLERRPVQVEKATPRRRPSVARSATAMLTAECRNVARKLHSERRAWCRRARLLVQTRNPAALPTADLPFPGGSPTRVGSPPPTFDALENVQEVWGANLRTCQCTRLRARFRQALGSGDGHRSKESAERETAGKMGKRTSPLEAMSS